jgi:hypothetical protein
MLNIDTNKMSNIIQAAFDKAQGSKRWQTAIARAKEIIESNPYLHLAGDTLLMLSDSGEIYEVTRGACPCKAFQQGQPCKHRATRQLLLRYSETSH